MPMIHEDILDAVAAYLETLTDFNEADVATSGAHDREFSIRVVEAGEAEEPTWGRSSTTRRMRIQIRTQYTFPAGTEREFHAAILTDQITIRDQLPAYCLDNAVPCAILPDGPRTIEPIRSAAGAYAFVSVHPWVITYLEEQTP